MDYSKIKLENERNEHVTKRLNRLSTWKFFKVIYRENIWRMFGYNFLMILCLVPMFVMLIIGSFNVSRVMHIYPLYNGFGFGTGAWFGGEGQYGNVTEFLAMQVRTTHFVAGAYTVLASLAAALILSAGFAVVRDAFWTGKLSTVGVFKSMWMGIKSGLLYALFSTMCIASMVFGLYVMFVVLNEVCHLLWLAILLVVVLGVVALFVTMYLLILCSVAVTYKQSVTQNLDDAWRLLWLNVLPNLLHLLVALIPIALYFVFSSSILQQIYLIVMLMFGGLYFPLVWQTHMMKTFALFHPVEVRKKKQNKSAQGNGSKQGKAKAEPTGEITEEPDPLPAPAPEKEPSVEPETEPAAPEQPAEAAEEPTEKKD